MHKSFFKKQIDVWHGLINNADPIYSCSGKMWQWKSRCFSHHCLLGKIKKHPAPRKRIRTRLYYFQSDLKAFKFFHTSSILYEFSIYKNWKILISGDEAVLFPCSCVIAYSFRYHSNGVKLPITLGKEIVLFFLQLNCLRFIAANFTKWTDGLRNITMFLTDRSSEEQGQEGKDRGSTICILLLFFFSSHNQ